MAKKIVCVHLFNDFSGSPLVLSQVINGFIDKGLEVDLYTSKSSQEGFLSNLKGVNNYGYYYKWNKNKWITLFLFMLSQTLLCFKLLKYAGKDVTIYINTILPFGPALAGKIMGKEVVYHVHETSINPPIFKKFLFFFAKSCASKTIYVSKFLREEEPIGKVPAFTVYNALSNEFIQKVKLLDEKKDFIVLMLCSLKEYKGVWEFVQLAKDLPQLKFELVLNSDQVSIDAFFRGHELSENITLFPSQSNVHPFYQRASLVCNLSRPKEWVETFGMTALEAMLYSLPVIVPPVGGPPEVVTDQVNGYLIDSTNRAELKEKVGSLASNKEKYETMCKASKELTSKFSIESLQEGILDVLSR